MSTPYFRQWEPLLPPTGLASGKLLVVSPHPDDEVIGAGGLVLGQKMAGQETEVVVLTDGRMGDPGGDQSDAYVSLRKDECRAAAEILGTQATHFFDFPDCELAPLLASGDHTPIVKLAGLLAQGNYGTIAAPSPYELHPDHKAAFLIAFEAWAQGGKKERMILYEVGSLMPCNCLLDVTATGDEKDRALQAYASQLAHHDILAKVQALDFARCANIPDAAVKRCEGYLEVKPDSADDFKRLADEVLRVTDRMKPGIENE